VATGEYRAIKRDGVIPDPEVDEFGAYMRAVTASRVVHPDDVGRFLADLNLSSIRERLYRQETVLGIYRSEILAKNRRSHIRGGSHSRMLPIRPLGCGAGRTESAHGTIGMQ